MKNKRRATNILVNPKFQLNFVKQLLGLLLLVYLSAILVGYWFYEPLLSHLTTTGSSLETQIMVKELTSLGYFMAIALFAVMALFFIGASLIISHKIVGPIYNLENSLIEMSSKRKLRKVRFRKGDSFITLERTFNDFVDSFDKSDS